MKNTTCRYCKRPLTAQFMAERLARKIERLQESFARARKHGEHIGRPREHDYGKIRWLRENGLSIRKIASHVGCAIATVQRAVKRRA